MTVRAICRNAIFEFVDAAVVDCQALTNEGDQMHRRAVAGKPLVVHVHGWDETANNRAGGRAVSLRIEGQYVDRGERFVAPTTEYAEQFAAQVRFVLAGMCAPVAK